MELVPAPVEGWTGVGAGMRKTSDRCRSFAHGRADGQGRMSGDGRGLRGPLLFGVTAATIQLAVIVALLYC